jgi:hypothetical protein
LLVEVAELGVLPPLKVGIYRPFIVALRAFILAAGFSAIVLVFKVLSVAAAPLKLAVVVVQTTEHWFRVASILVVGVISLAVVVA